MNIYLTRHGQTDLNKAHRMQGRSDIPLNDTGIRQAQEARANLLTALPGLAFDAVYASPLDRAVTTASIIGNVPKESVHIDIRIIEADFGRYEQRKYALLGPCMSLYWALPELFKAPSTVEATDEMISRARAFLTDLKKQPYENVLVVCHGGILRVLRGLLEGAPRGYVWRPKPHNCEMFLYTV